MGVIEVEIGPGAAGTFTVHVVNSAAGEATEIVALDVDGLLQRRKQLQQVVLMSSMRSRRLLDENERVVREVGQDLFTALLGYGEVVGLYRSSAALAASSGEGLRVVLRIEDPKLAGLPWEAMYDAKRGRYICRAEQLVRHVPVAHVPTTLAVRPPLRILTIASSPRGLPELNVQKEKDQLTSALEGLVGDGQVDLQWATQATWSRGRAEIIGLNDRTLEWVTPVLYLRGDETHLFALAAPETPPAQAPVKRRAPPYSRARLATIIAGLTIVLIVLGSLLIFLKGQGQEHVSPGLRKVGSIAIGDSVSGIALSPDGRYCYATQSNGQVSVIETKRGAVAATIPSPGSPIAVAVSPDGRRAYVSHWGSPDVTVVDTGTNTVIASIDVGSLQWGVAVASHRAYVALRGSGTVAVIDTASNAVTTRIRTSTSPTDSPVEVAVTADGRRVYATNRGSASVSVIDTATNTLTATIPVQAGPNGVAVTRDGRYILATNEGSGTLSQIAAATGHVTDIAVGGAPVTVVVSGAGDHAYVVSRGSRTVSDIDIVDGVVSASLNLGGDPGDIALAPDGHRLYIANAGLNAITVLDTGRS